MRVAIGGGWSIHHLTDRVVELRKDDFAYRRATGRDGYVRVRAEPGMNRQTMIAKAVAMAQRNDEALAARLSKQLLPSAHALAEYTGKQVQMVRAMSTGDEPELIGAKKA